MLDTLGTLQRTHTCGELRASDVGKQVVLMGWVAKKRDFGVFTFIDLRDRDGITQVVVSSEKAPDAHAKAKNIRGEFVIAVKGEVVSRAEGTHNAKLATGDIEIKVTELLVLNDAKVPPFQLEVAGSENLASEDTRLKYRYLDLTCAGRSFKTTSACVRRRSRRSVSISTTGVSSRSRRPYS